MACSATATTAGVIGDYDMKQAEAERSDVIGNLARARRASGSSKARSRRSTGRSARDVFVPIVARADVVALDPRGAAACPRACRPA